MCGIAFDARRRGTVDPASLWRMIGVLQHRGPDGQYVWCSPDERIGLAHARLTIVDLSARGNQPMPNEDESLWLTCNGEIYNHRELRQQLIRHGHRFRSDSDNEVLLHGYEQWGEGMLDRLRGMFAFAIADTARDELFLARDRIGEKPLVVCEDDGGVAGASEAPALLAAGRGCGPLDPRAVSYMLARNLRHVPEPLCAFSRLTKLPPGHCMRVRDGQVVACGRWWKPTWRGPRSDRRRLRSSLQSAVDLECQADVEVGALLSGGVDSSAVVGLAGQRATGMRTYALGRDGHDEELLRAAAAARRFGAHLQTRTFSAQQLERLEALIRQLGEPIALLTLTHADVLMHDAAASGLRVVLTGNGADELLWGYDNVARLRRVSEAMSMLDRAPKSVRRAVGVSSPLLRVPLPQRKIELYRGAVAAATEVLRPELRKAALMPPRCPVFTPWADAFDGSSYAELSQFFTLVVEDAHSVTIHGDLVGMRHSVEVRSPFLDANVVADALRLPEREKAGSLLRPEGKRVLKRGLRDVIGTDVARAPKMGFGFALSESELIRTSLREAVSDRLHQGEGISTYCDKPLVTARLREHLEGQRDHGKLLLSLYAFDVWYEAFRQYLVEPPV